MSTIQLGVLVICETLAKMPPNSTNCISEKSGQNAPKLSVMVKYETIRKGLQPRQYTPNIKQKLKQFNYN